MRIYNKFKSSNKKDHTLIPDGTVLELTFHPSAVSGDDGLGVMKSVLEVYMAGGGEAVKFNVRTAYF